MRVGSSDVLIHSSQGDLGQLLDAVMEAEDHVPSPVAHILMLHPGFVDAQLMRSSSLTLPRAVDAELLRSSALKTLAELGDIELVTYRDL